MVQVSAKFLLAVSAIAVQAHGVPLMRRIAQTIIDSTTPWEDACDTAGGGEQCNTIAVNAAETLLAAAGPCDQQNAADTMVTLAKQLNSTEMVTLAQIFAQQPRNTPNSLAVPYCQQAPNNTELDGLFQCQFEGASETTFVGSLAVGSAGTIPFGQTTVVTPAGSCPAHTSGPIADGTQLVNITTNPGTGTLGNDQGNNTVSDAVAATSAVASASATEASSSAAAVSTTAVSAVASVSSAVSTAVVSTAAATTSAIATTEATTDATTTASATASAASSTSSSFLLSNGQEAQQLNAQFATLTANSSCTDGTQACVNGKFAQCVDDVYELTSCGSGLSCYALPLVNSAGTSITCDTEADAEDRIANTGVTGGITGSNSTSSAVSASASASATASA